MLVMDDFHGGLSIADVNECQINNHECLEHQRCDNTIGSYTCIRLHSCGTGYTFNAATAMCDGEQKYDSTHDHLERRMTDDDRYFGWKAGY